MFFHEINPPAIGVPAQRRKPPLASSKSVPLEGFFDRPKSHLCVQLFRTAFGELVEILESSWKEHRAFYIIVAMVYETASEQWHVEQIGDIGLVDRETPLG